MHPQRNRSGIEVRPKLTLDYLIKVGKSEITDPLFADPAKLREELRRRLPGKLGKKDVSDADIDTVLGIVPHPDAVDEVLVETVKDDHFTASELPEIETLPESPPPVAVVTEPTIETTTEELPQDITFLVRVPQHLKDQALTVPVRDNARNNRSASQWTAAELLALVYGRIEKGSLLTDNTVERALRANFDLTDPAWSLQDIIQNLTTGTLPPKTSTGVWVRDITRAARGASGLTDAEIQAYLQGEIELPPAINPADIDFVLRARHKDKSGYSIEQLREYARSGKDPEMVEGVLVDDPVRRRKHASQWSEHELKLYASKKISATEAATHRDLMLACRKTFNLPAQWHDDDIIQNLTTGTLPPKTSTGVWVRDITRNHKPVDALSVEELAAFCRGEITLTQFMGTRQCVPLARNRLILTRGDTFAHWSDDEIYRYLKEGTAVNQTASGLWPNDPVRARLSAREWSNAEMVAWLKGEIEPTRRAPHNALVNALHVKYRLDPAWSFAEIRRYVLEGTLPPKTSTGVWVNDCERDDKPVGQWTTAELIAYCRGEIHAGTQQTDDVIIEHVCDRFNYPRGLSSNQVKQLVGTLKKEPVNMSLDFITTGLSEYKQVMDIARLSNEREQGVAQGKLYRIIMRTTMLEGADFIQGWSKILAFFHAHARTLFAVENRTRGWGYLDMADRDRQNFERLINLLALTASPSGRKAALRNSVRLDYSLKNLRNQKAQQRIVAFYEM
ncbi:hypothetical protein ACLPJK_26320 [Pseudomonas aeruginosa]|uniref:hypothetical protein n=1 Tax=Pseudomonas aeruginosa TaxID=287 RepID=UPI003D2BE975